MLISEFEKWEKKYNQVSISNFLVIAFLKPLALKLFLKIIFLESCKQIF